MNKSSTCIAVVLFQILVTTSFGDESDSTASAASASETVTTESDTVYRLAYRFAAGQKLSFRTIKTATTEAMWQENRKTDDTETEEHRRFTVHSVKESKAADISMQFEYVRLQNRTNGGPWEQFDTRMKPSDIPAGMRTIAEQLKGKAPKFLIEADGSCGITDALTKDADQYSSESFLITLPDHGVKIGESWSQTQQAKVRLNKEISRQIDILQTYRLVSVRDGIAEISMNSSLNGPSLSPHVRAQLIQSTPRGTLHFDMNQGIMIRRQWRFDQLVINAMGENTALRSFGTYTDEYIPGNSADTEIQPVSAKESGAGVISAGGKQSDEKTTPKTE